MLYDWMRGSRNVCLLNTGIDPSPPPTMTKIQKAARSAFSAGPSSAYQQNTWSPPLKSRIRIWYAIFKHYSKWMLAFINLHVLQKGELLRNVPLYKGA